MKFLSLLAFLNLFFSLPVIADTVDNWQIRENSKVIFSSNEAANQKWHHVITDQNSEAAYSIRYNYCSPSIEPLSKVIVSLKQKTVATFKGSNEVTFHFADLITEKKINSGDTLLLLFNDERTKREIG